MSSASSRITRVAAALAFAAIVGAGCTPAPTPSGPSLAVQVGVVFNNSSIEIKADPSGFGGSGDYTVEWALRDTASNAVVATGTPTAYSDDLISIGAAALSNLSIGTTGATSSTQYSVTVTYGRNGQTASRTVVSAPSWPAPTSPQIADLNVVQSGTYQLNHFTPAVCTPIGTNVHIEITGGAEPARLFFLDYTVPFGSNGESLPPGGGSVDLVTTTPCWSAVWVRASFVGITGNAHGEFSWSLPAA